MSNQTNDLPPAITPSDRTAKDIAARLADRKMALEFATESMAELVRICRRLEITVDGATLTILRDLAAQHEYNAVKDRQQRELEARTSRLPMRIVSEDSQHNPIVIPRGTPAQILIRPQWITYRIDEIEIDDEPNHWLVHDIKVGNRSQRLNNLPLVGGSFRDGGLMGKIKLDTILVGMDFSMIVEYIGPLDGAVFQATTIGIAVEDVRG